MNTPIVSIVIVNYNGGQDVYECLQTLFKYTDVPFEVISG